jgi:hypothetical protein
VATLAVSLTLLAPQAVGDAAHPTTYQGRTAHQWQRAMTRMRVQRDHARQRAGKAIRHGRRVDRELAGMRHRFTRHLSAIGTHPLEAAFLCIHSGEGAWTDPNAPYYGGLQMDYEFQHTYGPEFLKAWGTADHWPASVQMTVAMRAYLSGRGFAPWPVTSRACGLR